MTEEALYIIEQFQQNILFRHEKIAIYGIGKNTKLILATFPEAPIVGLMDAACQETFLYGKKLLTENEIVGNVDTILIVARKAVQNIIYPRIKKYKEKGINIINLEGENVGERTGWKPEKLPEWSVDPADIRAKIDQHACISFDLFDTLLMRRFLLPIDVFETAVRELNLPEEQRAVVVKVRQSVEKEAEALRNYDEIYYAVANRCSLSEKQINFLKRREYELEKENLRAREAMVILLEYARKCGKKIFFLSDMYYGSTDLKDLCAAAGIAVEESEIMSSCEIHASKENGNAFLYLIQASGEKQDSILHIGDNAENDCRKAQEAGIDTVHILSAYEMLLHSSLSSFLSDTSAYEKRCLLGILISEIFNNPFVLNSTRGKVNVEILEQLGYYCGSIFYCFCSWLTSEVHKKNIEQLILPGRDGWLIKRILDVWKPPFFYTYIRASRRAYELAAIENKEELIQVLAKGKDFKGTKQQLLQTRFGLMHEEIDGKTNEEIYNVILSKAADQRESLLQYFYSQGIQSGRVTGMFDCVASGSVHVCMQKLLKERITGFYFGVMLPQKKGIDIFSAFGAMSNYYVKSSVLEHYLIIESLLSEIIGTLIGFQNGKMVYENNAPNEELELVQKGILRFVKDALEVFHGDEGHLPYCEEIMTALFGDGIEVSEEIKKIFVYDDCYMGDYKQDMIWK